jgi:hypothetical protein
MLFVHHAQLGKGIGARLWEAARLHVDSHHPDVKTVELNASPYAVTA